jgi:hypothetical protein
VYYTLPSLDRRPGVPLPSGSPLKIPPLSLVTLRS